MNLYERSQPFLQYVDRFVDGLKPLAWSAAVPGTADAAVLPMPNPLPIANDVTCFYKIRTHCLAVSAIIRIHCHTASSETTVLDSPLFNSYGEP